jgi:hypothetical protein
VRLNNANNHKAEDECKRIWTPVSQSITYERALPIQANIENETRDNDGKYSITEGSHAILEIDSLSYCGAAEYTPW